MNNITKLKVLREGLMTSFQDFGILSSQHLGITTSGVMDDYLFKIGNIILFNKLNTPSLEFAIIGPKLKIVSGNLNLVIAGNVSFNLIINDKNIKGECFRTYFLKKNDIIDIKSTINSNYGYLCVKNGFLSNSINGSYSTIINANIGANKGKKLLFNQTIKANSSIKSKSYKLENLEYFNQNIIKVIKGPQMNYFKIKDIDKFFKKEFTISKNLNRIGVRLINNIIKPFTSYNIDSEGIIKGSVQVPGDGNPIVLGADHPTIGGYPKIVTIIMDDFRKLIQLPAGKKFKFKEISLEEAEETYFKTNKHLKNIKDKFLVVD